MKRPRRQPREEPDGSFSGVHRRQTLKSAAWAFRVLFVLALVAAIWYTRPERNPPGTPIAGESGTTTTDRIELPTPEERAARDTDSDPFERDESVDASASPHPAAADPIEIEIQRTLDRIAADGPYPFRQDDTVFVNREGRLPKQALGYYREYTVVTPGADDRGARRIVRGQRGELYYTDDHYGSFRRIDNRPGSEPPRRDRQPSRRFDSTRTEGDR